MIRWLRWRKVFRELWLHRSRTSLVVLSIAVGVYAVGVMLNMRFIVGHDMIESYEAVNPAQAILYTSDWFDEAFLKTIRRIPEVKAVDGRLSYFMQFQIEGQDTWYPIQVFVLPDYDDIQVSQVYPEKNFEIDPIGWPNPEVWPPPRRGIVLERTSFLAANLGLTTSEQNSSMRIQLPNGKERELMMSGIAYDFSRVPATNAGRAYGYITFSTLEWLGIPRGLNELHITVNGDGEDEEYIQQVAQLVRTKAEKNSLAVSRTQIPEPGKLPLDNQYQAITLILGALAILSLFLSGFLVTNTVTALLAQQERQIGIMKTIGARTDQIFLMQLGMVALLSIIALVLAVPAVAITSPIFIFLMSYFINFNLSGLSNPPFVFILEIFIGLLIPLLAAVHPIRIWTHLSVKDAIDNRSLLSHRNESIERWLKKIRFLPRPLILSLRNVFRRRGRLILTVITLTLGSATFISVTNVRASLLSTLDSILQYQQFDVRLSLNQPYRIIELERRALQVNGVDQVEGWGLTNGHRLRPNNTESQIVGITGVPANSQLIEPILLEGRWLEANDTTAIVINEQFLQQEPDLIVGSDLTLMLDGEETIWQVIGIVQTAAPQNLAFVNYNYYTRLIGEIGQASTLLIQTHNDDPEFQLGVAAALEEYFDEVGITVSFSETKATIRENLIFFFNIIVSLLGTMSIILAVVGGLGLMGTMSINVIERIREIGVMRAIGASTFGVLQIFIVEGLLISTISWLLGVVIAIPLGWILSNEVGLRFLGVKLNYTLSSNGIFLSLGLSILVALVSTWLPAQRAASISVQEAIADR